MSVLKDIDNLIRRSLFMPEICSYCFTALTPRQAGSGNCPECRNRLRGGLRDRYGVIKG